jgi:hypothetical protein
MKIKMTIIMPVAIAAILMVLSELMPNLNGFNFSLLGLVLTLALYPSFSLRIGEQQNRRLTVLNENGFFKWLLSGLAIRLTLAIIFSVITAFFVILFVVETPMSGWVFFIIGSSCLFWLKGVMRNKLNKEYRYPYNELRENTLAKLVASGCVTICTASAMLIVKSTEPTTDLIFTSHLLQEMVSISEFFGFWNDFLINKLIKSAEFKYTILGVVLLFFKFTAGFYLLFSVLDSVTLPQQILGKSISGIEHFENPNWHAKQSLVWAASLTIFLAIILWFPVTAKLEYLSSKRFFTENKEPIRKKAIQLIEVTVELINGEFYQPGTIDKIEAYEKTIQIKYDASNFNTLMKKEINLAFIQMEKNTDIFLDHYYSLGAEYMRIAKMFSGELDQYLKKELLKALETNDPFKKITILVEREKQLRENFFSLRNEHLYELQELLERNVILIKPNQKPKISKHKDSLLLGYDLGNLIKDPEKALPVRFGVSVGSGVIVGLIVKKIIAKGTLKTLATAIAKVAAKKAAGVGVGAGIGGVIGSVVPGIGTAVVAGVGSVVGAVSMEWLGLQLDEAVNRDELRADILEAISQQKRDLLNSL